MLHVSSSSQTLVAKLGLGPGGGRNFDERLGGMRSMRTRVYKICDFAVSGVRWYNRSPELYLLGYKYSTLVGGLTAALSYSANHTHGQ